MRFVPADDLLVVLRREPQKGRTVSRDDGTEVTIHTPTVAEEQPYDGEVIKVGPGARDREDPRRRIPVAYSPGQRVVFTKYGGQEILLDGVKHMLLREAEILGVLE